MSDKVTDFPQYRKLSNNNVFYRLRSDRNFDEIQLIGKTARLFSMEAKQYPELLKIKDLLSLSMIGYEMSSSEEFEFIREKYNL